MNKLVVLLVFLTIIGISSGQTGCQQQDPWTNSDFSDLMNKLKSVSFNDDRWKILVQSVSNAVRGFNTNQTVQILKMFDYTDYKIKFLTGYPNLLLGIDCTGCYNILMTLFADSDRIGVLPYLVNITVDLNPNNATILNAFTFSSSKQKAQEIINKSTKFSCIWGDITTSRVVFVVDTSGSMSTSFNSSIDYKIYTRLGYVALQLKDIILSLPSNFEMNIISFNSYAAAWSPGIVAVNNTNINSAVNFVSGLRASGSTNMKGALTLAFSDPKAVGVYLLSDGQPDCCNTQLVTMAQTWSNNGTRWMNTISYQAGGSYDPVADKFMFTLASVTHGIARSIR